MKNMLFLCKTHFYHYNSWQITEAKISFSFLNIMSHCYFVNPLCLQQESVPTKLKVALSLFTLISICVDTFGFSLRQCLFLRLSHCKNTILVCCGKKRHFHLSHRQLLRPQSLQFLQIWTLFSWDMMSSRWEPLNIQVAFILTLVFTLRLLILKVCSSWAEMKTWKAWRYLAVQSQWVKANIDPTWVYKSWEEMFDFWELNRSRSQSRTSTTMWEWN